MKYKLENFAIEKGNEIAKRIMERFEVNSFDTEGLIIEKEIYERAMHEATGFFLDNDSVDLHDQIEALRKHLSTRVDSSSKEIRKLNIKEVLGSLIKVYTIDTLGDNDLLLI